MIREQAAHLPEGIHVTDKRAIVVGIDGSEQADRAVIWAALSASGRGLALRLVIAVDVPPHLDDEQTAEFRAIATARLVAAEGLARDTVEGKSLEVSTEARDGNVMEVLLAESADCEMVVLGASGLGESDSGVLGSAAIGLCAHAASPVAVVRGRSIDGMPPMRGPVVVGVDGSAINQAAIARAFDEASQRKSPLVAVHVWSDVALSQISGVPREWTDISVSEEAVLAESLAGWQENYPDVEVRRIVAQDRPVRVIEQLSERSSLIVVGHRGRGGFEGMMLGSTSYALIQTADCPVLVVRGGES